MATRNYRQAKRSREETRKKRQQAKMLRKVNRGAAGEPAPGTDLGPNAVDGTNKAAS